MRKVDYLRKQHPKFIYESYKWALQGGDLVMSFSFLIVGEPNIQFYPRVTIKNIDQKKVRMLAKSGSIDAFVFHMGLAEIPSYWKAAASSVIEVKAGYLDSRQKRWWKKLILKGMGEYFYINRIDFTKPKFLTITSNPLGKTFPIYRYTEMSKYRDRVLVPVGGGKDSIVTLEILKRKFPVRCFSLNPTKRVLNIIEESHTLSPIVCERQVDPMLLKLNLEGYLNGHTPFSSYLAFLAVFCATLFDYRFIALSNERGASEGNVIFHDRIINHQYSKSLEFEKDFRDYSKRYLTSSHEYFSFMRPLYELQIARAFARFPRYFPYVLSCNKDQKTGEWCGACAKCLFVYLILYPFVERQILKKMYGADLLEKKGLLPILEELGAIKRHKPFDCVGTKEEVLQALSLAIGKTHTANHPLPVLLRIAELKILPLGFKPKNILGAWTPRHFLPQKFVSITQELLSHS